MNEKTRQITTGAMFVAIFAMILLVNRQTGGLFEELIFFLLPIPMVAYSARYGLKVSIPVWIAMSLISVLFGTITTVFYAVMESMIGLVLGSCIYKNVDISKTLLVVMGLSSVVNVLNTIVLASLFGYDLNTEIAQMQTMMNNVFEKTGVMIPEQMMATDYLMRMLVISMVFLGLIQGYLVYQISLLILRRLRFKIQKPKSVFVFYPWKWTAYVALAGLIGYMYTFVNPLENQLLQNLLTSLGILGCIYLFAFGVIGLILLTKKYISRRTIIAIIISLLAYMLFSQALILTGFFYIATNLHAYLMKLPDK